jgi:16S rRNA G966 N2-methylase RsmD
MSETPDIRYGRLLESAHISGYSFERLCDELLWLLEGDRWQKVGAGYTDVNTFLRSIDLSPFNLGDNRPKLHKRIKELQPKASTRAIGQMTGTPQRTVADHVTSKDPERNRSEAVADKVNDQRVVLDPERFRSPDMPAGQEKADAALAEIDRMTGREAAKTVRQATEKAERAVEREQRERQRAAERAVMPPPTLPDGIRIENCRASELMDTAEIEPGSVDLIFTDPPYPVEFVGCWTELGELAVKALKPGGLAVAYTGQYTMPEALDRLRRTGLDYFWTYAIQHDGAFFQMYVTHVQCGWKPLLVFRNGPGDPPNWHKDVVTDGGREKTIEAGAQFDGGTWQQSEAEAAYWINELSAPDQLVCDPFVGSGTTAAVARSLGRRFVGCDVDPKATQHTRERLS